MPCGVYIAGLQAAGQYATAVAFAHRQLEAAHARQADSLAMRLLLGLASIHYENAQLTALQTAATTISQVARYLGFGLSGAWSHCILGWAHYQRNELAAAEQCFRNFVALAHAAHGRAVVDGYTGLALTALAQGQAHEALAPCAILRKLLERGMLAFAPIVESLQQRVSLACAPSSALDWRYSGRTAQVLIPLWEQPALTQVRTLLARGKPADLAQAAELLNVTRSNPAALITNLEICHWTFAVLCMRHP